MGSSLFIITMNSFTSLAVCLYFAMITKIWLPFCLRYNPLLSLGVFYMNREKCFFLAIVNVVTKNIWNEDRRNREVRATKKN